ncbi:hypothetical protein L3X38_011427 [Prunus dulcis]|uniref:Uncharacterized protein n=1 Tax=Prunus dulcis TaxID=3755 RepID=A0AAD4ZFE5_PRUDU|nr:hypothetical protein L3X38_011427 [Prunus dulcis]
MGDSPPTEMGTGIPRNLLNGDWFGDGGGDGERGRGWYCHTRPLPDPLPSLGEGMGKKGGDVGWEVDERARLVERDSLTLIGNILDHVVISQG